MSTQRPRRPGIKELRGAGDPELPGAGDDRRELAGETAAPGIGPRDSLPIPAAGSVTLDVLPHPVTTAERWLETVQVAPGDTLAHVVARAGLDRGNLEVSLDGRVIPPPRWRTTPLATGQIVTVRAAVARGGDTNPLRTVLQLAVLVTGIVVGGTLGGIITIAGSLLINALIPPRLPRGPDRGESRPVYSLVGGANRARPYEALPLVLGQHRMFPDLGAAEHTEFIGEDQYLSSIFHWGLGAHLDIPPDEVRIGNTPLLDFEIDDDDIQWSDATGALTLVPGNVDSVAGAVLDSAAWVTRSASAGATQVGLDFVGLIYRIGDDGNLASVTVNLTIELVAGTQTVTQRLALTNATATQVRRTVTYALPARTDGSKAAWTVRVKRAVAPSSDDKINDKVEWSALRSYQPDTADYAGQTRLALRIRASGQLTGRLDRLSGMVRQQVPAWDGTLWGSPGVTSNPAWIFRWFALGIQVAGRTVAGAGLPATRIDETSIKAWGAWCDAQQLRCDYVIQSSMSIADVLHLIAQCGRASPTWQAGKLGVVYEDAARAPSALVTPGNILDGSFEVGYASGPIADEIVARFVDPGSDWNVADVRRNMPGVLVPERPIEISLQGVTTRRQAAVECNLHAASQVHHRRRLRWAMGPAALTSLHRGDVVWVTGSLIDGGASGRLAGFDSATRTRLDLGRDVAITSDTDHLLLQLPEGTLHTSVVVHPDAETTTGVTSTVLLNTPLPVPSDRVATKPNDVLWRYYSGAAEPVKARIVSVQPRPDRTVYFEAVDESAAYHAAATADLTIDIGTPPVRWPTVIGVAISEVRITTSTTTVEVDDEDIESTHGYLIQLEATLEVAGNWTGCVFRVARPGMAPHYEVHLPRDTRVARWIEDATATVIEVTVVPGLPGYPVGTPFTRRYTIGSGQVDADSALKPPSSLSVTETGTAKTRVYAWTLPPGRQYYGARIRYGPSSAPRAAWNTLTPLGGSGAGGRFRGRTVQHTAPGAGGSYVFVARSVSLAADGTETLSADDVRTTATLSEYGGPPVIPPTDPSSGDDLIDRTPLHTLYQVFRTTESRRPSQGPFSRDRIFDVVVSVGPDAPRQRIHFPGSELGPSADTIWMSMGAVDYGFSVQLERSGRMHYSANRRPDDVYSDVAAGYLGLWGVDGHPLYGRVDGYLSVGIADRAHQGLHVGASGSPSWAEIPQIAVSALNGARISIRLWSVSGACVRGWDGVPAPDDFRFHWASGMGTAPGLAVTAVADAVDGGTTATLTLGFTGARPASDATFMLYYEATYPASSIYAGRTCSLPSNHFRVVA